MTSDAPVEKPEHYATEWNKDQAGELGSPGPKTVSEPKFQMIKPTSGAGFCRRALFAKDMDGTSSGRPYGAEVGQFRLKTFDLKPQGAAA
jgi:hypothetical protein